MSVVTVIGAALLLYRFKEDERPRSLPWARLGMTLLALGLGFRVALGHTAELPALAAALAALSPWTIARRVFVPLGMWRAAYAAGWLAKLSWDGHPGGDFVAGAWALARRDTIDPDAMAALEQRREASARLSGAHILGTALLAAARGDRETARAMLIGLRRMGNLAPRLARRLAGEWLAADAAERGAWRDVAAVGASGGPRTRATRFLLAVTARLTGAPGAPGRLQLRLLWILAPARLATRRLLALALSSFAIAEPGPDPGRSAGAGLDLPPPERADSLATALRHHVALCHAAARDVTPATMVAVAQAWDRALADPATRDGTAHRAAVLGADAPARAIDSLTRGVEAELARLVRDRRIRLDALDASSPTLARAVHSVREKLLSDIEISVERLGRRVQSRRALPALDEWREVLALWRLYDEAAAAGGLELRRVAFPDIHHHVGNLAAWLWNERNELAIANAMFRWLLEEATAVGDEEAIRLQKRNNAI